MLERSGQLVCSRSHLARGAQATGTQQETGALCITACSCCSSYLLWEYLDLLVSSDAGCSLAEALCPALEPERLGQGRIDAACAQTMLVYSMSARWDTASAPDGDLYAAVTGAAYGPSGYYGYPPVPGYYPGPSPPAYSPLPPIIGKHRSSPKNMQ